MKKLIVLIIPIVFSPFSFGMFDQVGDVDTAKHCKQLRKEDITSIDIKKLSFKFRDNKLIASINVVSKPFDSIDYKEYYLWIDTDPNKKRGYVPYFDTAHPQIDELSSFQRSRHQAWTNFYADYRIFISRSFRYKEERRAFQNCTYQNCSNLNSYKDFSKLGIDYHLGKGKRPNKITFEIPLSTIKVVPGQEIQIGATTFYSSDYFRTCSGEDDFPDWGKPAVSLTVPFQKY